MILEIKGKCISKDNEKIMNKQGRFFLSNKYKRYEADIIWQVAKQLQPSFKTFQKDVSVKAIFCFENKVHPDLTNCCKGVFDALNGLVWKDDKQIKLCTLELLYTKKDPRILLDITEII